MVAALFLSHYFQGSLFVFMVGLSSFGALFAWLMTLLTHLAFRRFHKRRARPYLQVGPPGPWASLAGFTAVLAVLVSTWWVPGFRVTLLAGVPWLAFITLGYWAWSRAKRNHSKTAIEKE
jgi:L-asparagine transporter-like permease